VSALEVAVVGPPFLDVTFEGLPALPALGEEVVARALHIAPGGTGMQAIGAARLGLATGLVAALERAGGAGLLRETLEAEGVRIVEGRSEPGSVPTTALLATAEGVAMATALSGREPTAADVTAADARAVVASLGRLHLARRPAAAYAVTGGLELERVVDATRARLPAARALVVNAAEAAALTGLGTPEEAARDLARLVPVAVVTMGSEGALAASGSCIERASAPRVEVVDATGAGDLFVAAYVWADVRGAPLAHRLAWACLYAGLSVRAPTALEGALGLDALLEEGRARRLPVPRDVAR
jgi:sugar/nucleoside kinase (ribokinase family)